MTTRKPISALDKLEALRRRFGSDDTSLRQALTTLSKSKLDAATLIHFHETLLFLRAYPPSIKALDQVERILRAFEKGVSQLRRAEADLSPFDDPEVSGIAGTTVTSNFSYHIVRWLVAKHQHQVGIDWGWFEEEDRFGAIMPRIMPLLEEDAMVEAHIPYREWLSTARGRAKELSWIIRQFESLKLSKKERAEHYDSLKLHITWKFGFRASRTGMALPVRKICFHDKPLIRRRDVSLVTELASPTIPVQKLSRDEGERIIDMARETSAVRYRELHGFTYGDHRRVLKAYLGGGVDVFVMGVPAEHRLPLRAYTAALILKNGVPVAYFEGLSIFERMESGFNLYYTFREGETAWIFSRILRLMRQLLGVTVFSIDPYQIGHENEEGIESGAFWFYRKLGFRPVRPDLMKLTLAEEKKIAASPRHRTAAKTLRKLAAGHMLFEAVAGKQHNPSANWDRFLVRNLGLAVQRRMARDFGGEATRIRDESIKSVTRNLSIDTRNWNQNESQALSDLSLVLALIPDLGHWSDAEKQLVSQVIRAKAGSDEGRYLSLMQEHALFRNAVIKLGSA